MNAPQLSMYESEAGRNEGSEPMAGHASFNNPSWVGLKTPNDAEEWSEYSVTKDDDDGGGGR